MQTTQQESSSQRTAPVAMDDLEAGLVYLGRIRGEDLKGKRYQFHRAECPVKLMNPEQDEDFFVRKGKSTSGSVRWQCKECGKFTNVIPENVSRLRYNQKRSGIMPDLLRQIINNMSVTQICENLQINPKTYYHKLKLLAGQLEQMKAESEVTHFASQMGGELYLDCRICIREEGKRKIALVISTDPTTGYVYRGDYWVSKKEHREFWAQILPAHFHLIRVQTGAERARIVPNAVQESICSALEQAQWPYRFIEGLSEGERLSNFLAPRLESAADKYIPYYLEIFTYVYNFAPDLLVQEGMHSEKTGPRAGFGLRDWLVVLEEG